MVRRTVLSWVVPRNGQMYGIRVKAGTVPGEGLWERRRNSERMEAKGGRRGEEGNWVWYSRKKSFCFWQWFCREIPRQPKIILHVLCKPSDVAWLSSYPRGGGGHNWGKDRLFFLFLFNQEVRVYANMLSLTSIKHLRLINRCCLVIYTVQTLMLWETVALFSHKRGSFFFFHQSKSNSA